MQAIWQTQAQEMMTEVRGKYISKDLLHELEHKVANRVPKHEYRAWMATQVNTGKYKVGRTTPHLGTTLLRTRAISMPTKPKLGSLANTRGKVQAWIKRRLDGAVHKHLSPAMVKQIMKNAARRQVTATAVEAAIVLEIAETNITMEWRPAGRGNRSERDAWTAVTHWLVKHAGYAAADARKAVKAAQTKTTTVPHAETTTRPVIIDYGEGWGGMKEGMGRVATVVGVDRKRQQKGKKEGKTTPDFLMDFTDGGDRLVHMVRDQSLTKIAELVGANFSPDCSSRTAINRLEESQGRGKGANAGKEDEEDEVTSLWAIVNSIIAYSLEHPTWAFTIENPQQSSLWQTAAIKHLQRMLKVRKVTTGYCCYGVGWKKPTTFLTNLTAKEWTPKAMKKHCKFCATNVRHPVKIIRRDEYDERPSPSEPGFTAQAAMNRVRPDLAEEIAKAMLARWKAAQQ